MKTNQTSLARLAQLVRLARNDKRGQVIPWVAFMMFLFLGMGAFVLDVGHGYICYRQLQAATDAAALAGAKEVYSSTSKATAAVYAAATGGANTYPSLQNVVIASGYPKFECLSTISDMGILCEGPNLANGANAIQVKETATIPTFFAQVFGVTNMNLSAVATAAKGKATPLNVALVIDTTLSMNDYDSDCGATQMQCAMNGAETLLQSLAPSIDSVSVFTFPNVDPTTATYDQTCAHGGAVGMPYTFPTLPGTASTGYVPASGGGTYEVTGYSADYRSSDSGSSPNTSSALVKTLGALSTKNSTAVQGCLASPSNAGNYGTYLAGAIYAAQASLGGELATRITNDAVGLPPPIDVMIILSDGNTNASTRYVGIGNPFFQTPPSATGIYPSDVGDCGQSVVAAQTAKSAGTLIFAIAYGSGATGNFNWNVNDPYDSVNNANCPTDQNSFFTAFGLSSNKSAYPNISPCQTMMDIASPDTAGIEFFYSDYNQSGSNSTCYASGGSPAGLSDIFAAIGGSLSHARLIPDGTT